MNIVFFKKLPKPRRFNYKPMYYDPDKEEAEQRKKALNSLQDGDPRERMRSEIRRKWHIDRSKPDKRNEFIRLAFYFIVAGFALYLIFFTEFVNKLVSIFLR